jgi:hypothetical protein
MRTPGRAGSRAEHGDEIENLHVPDATAGASGQMIVDPNLTWSGKVAKRMQLERLLRGVS